MYMRTGLLLLGASAALALLVLLRQALLVAFLGVLLATLLSFPVGWLSRLMPRGLATVLTLLAGGTLITGVGFVSYQPIATELSDLSEQVPAGLHRLQRWFAHQEQNEAVQELTKGQSVATTAKQGAAKVLEAVWSHVGLAAMGVTAIASGIMVIIVLAAFFVYEPKAYHHTIQAFLPRAHEPVLGELWQRLGLVLRSWMGGILISMTLMGSITGLGLWIAGIHNWLVLAALTFFGTFVPYVGAILTAIPGLILALGQSPTRLAAAAAVYLAVHVIEGYVVEPMVMKRAVVIHPGTLLLWQLCMGQLFGILGIMVATPLLACIKVTAGYLYVERHLNKALQAI